MARLQILELPMVHNGDQTETPFILVIDEVSEEIAADIANWPDDVSQRLGARHVLCFTEAIDIPANDMSTSPSAPEMQVIVGDDPQAVRDIVKQAVADEPAAQFRRQ